MPALLALPALLLGSYLLGCLNSAYYLVRRRTGADVRALGSGNAGARNAGRVLGRGGFLLVLLADMLRGALAVAAARALDAGPAGAALAALAVVAGHVWPVQLRGRGGKGVGPALGAALLLDWRVVALAAIAGALPFAAMRRATAAGLLAVAAAPLAALALGHRGWPAALFALLAAILLFAHRGDLRAMTIHPNPDPGR